VVSPEGFLSQEEMEMLNASQIESDAAAAQAELAQ
jgi:hypothetical protein